MNMALVMLDARPLSRNEPFCQVCGLRFHRVYLGALSAGYLVCACDRVAPVAGWKTLAAGMDQLQRQRKSHSAWLARREALVAAGRLPS